MSLRKRLDDDLKDAMRKRDTLRRSVIRIVKAEIRNAEIAGGTDLDDDGIIRVLGRQAQQRRDSIEAFSQGHRPDLVDKEKAELAVILEYLPRQMSSEEIRSVATRAIEEAGADGPQDMGKVMGKLMPQVRGKAEGREVNAIVTELLRGLSS